MKASKPSSVKILVVGDIHFAKDAKLSGDELIERLVDIAKEVKPTFIILLGDILDTHEIVRSSPWKQVERLFSLLSPIAPLYTLIGNHDLSNPSDFLTDNHFFNPYKIWPKITIVDKPIQIIYSGLKFVLCPYVPPGRFLEALNTLFDAPDDTSTEKVDWRDAKCIFAHQEFHGVVYNDKESSKGDEWSEELPLVISGHIHEEFELYNGRVLYTGSSRQVKFNESPDKKVWKVTFTAGKPPVIDKIPLGLKSKKEVEMVYENVKNFDFTLCDSYYIKLKIIGSTEQFKLFRKHPLHAKMLRHGIKIGFITNRVGPESLAERFDINRESTSRLSFEQVLKEVIKGKRQSIQDAYDELYPN